MCAYIDMYTYVYVYVLTCICIYKYADAYIHTYMHRKILTHVRRERESD